MDSHRALWCSAAAAWVAAACGGGADPPVELSIDAGPVHGTSATSIVLTGRSFVPSGSSCPVSNGYVIIGTLGAHQITYTNATTATSGPVFDQLWVCNSEDGRVMHWQSNPIDLVPGVNTISVTMTASGRSSSGSITITRTGG